MWFFFMFEELPKEPICSITTSDFKTFCHEFQDGEKNIPWLRSRIIAIVGPGNGNV